MRQGASPVADVLPCPASPYRAEQLNKIFGYLNLANVWAGVEKHSAVVSFMASRDPNETPHGILKGLVEDRNRASHSTVSETLSGPELQSLAAFLEAVVQVVSEICRKNCLVLECEKGLRLKVFQVTNLYTNGAVGGTFTSGELNVEDQLMAISLEGAFRVSVVSIQHHNVPLAKAEARLYPQLGLRLDRPVLKNTVLVALHKQADVPLSPDETPLKPKKSSSLIARLIAWFQRVGAERQ